MATATATATVDPPPKVSRFRRRRLHKKLVRARPNSIGDGGHPKQVSFVPLKRQRDVKWLVSMDSGGSQGISIIDGVVVETCDSGEATLGGVTNQVNASVSVIKRKRRRHLVSLDILDGVLCNGNLQRSHNLRPRQ